MFILDTPIPVKIRPYLPAIQITHLNINSFNSEYDDEHVFISYRLQMAADIDGETTLIPEAERNIVIGGPTPRRRRVRFIDDNGNEVNAQTFEGTMTRETVMELTPEAVANLTAFNTVALSKPKNTDDTIQETIDKMFYSHAIHLLQSEVT